MINEEKKRITITLRKNDIMGLQAYNKWGLSLSKQIEILIVNYLEKEEKKLFTEIENKTARECVAPRMSFYERSKNENFI